MRWAILGLNELTLIELRTLHIPFSTLAATTSREVCGAICTAHLTWSDGVVLFGVMHIASVRLMS